MVASSDYKDRFAKAMSDANKDAHAVAKVLGISYQAVMKVLAGTTKMLRADNNAVAAKAFEVDPDWLATGVGDMPRMSASAAPGRTDGQAAAAQWPFRRMSAEQWAALDDYDRVLVEDAAASKLRELVALRGAQPAADAASNVQCFVPKVGAGKRGGQVRSPAQAERRSQELQVAVDRRRVNWSSKA